MIDNNSLTNFPRLFSTWGLPFPRRVSILRNVVRLRPDHHLALTRRTFLGLLMNMHIGHAVAFVQNFYSFLSAEGWLCPEGITSNSAAYWVRQVYAEPPILGRFPHLDAARTYDERTTAAAIAPLVLRTTSIWVACEEARVLQHALFASLHGEVHSVPGVPGVDPVADPVADAVNAYLDWA